ncbi:MAG: Ca-activated chloride channel family protein [Candidatus Arcticimaribacter sp.]|jgi:Ca-activated chloride channel family protein
MNYKALYFLFSLLSSTLLWSQGEAANNLVVDGNKAHNQEEYIGAESQYRKAVSIAPNKTEALHNLGNTNYRIADYGSASQRFFQTQKNSNSKEEKHAAFHNLGNVYMQQKDYTQAVEAFKNGLRNNPKDEETRYNYALAKELLEKEKQEDQQDKQDQDQDKEGDQDQEKKDDKGEQEDPKDEGDEEKKENGEGGDSKEDSKDKPKEDKPKNPEKEGDSEKKKQPPPKPKPGQISPEQVKSLLEAMNNQEKGVQKKVNAQKVKGVPVKTKKDW